MVLSMECLQTILSCLELFFGGVLGAQRATKRSPILIETPAFLMVKMASGITRRRVRMTTTTTSLNKSKYSVSKPVDSPEDDD